ncbi:phosphatidate cytidylyltransferase [Acinetobacter apis]|uniref:Phosphatidate cytidylyltransferase n=1 Tax=Acinetobacter apis TaxID=1229165 RepID=A0A217EDF4_9GAMM|nr:CDP-archaeol synthase [Acinetobacter apis]SNQ28511.1 phosphatidate cytidylyltransferase [Acinetobacter apis]
MFERIKTALVLVAIVLLCMFATSSHYPMLILMLVAATVAGYEWFKLMPEQQDNTSSPMATKLYAFVIFIISSIALYYQDVSLLLWCASILIWIFSVYCIKTYPENDSWYNKGLNVVGAVLITAAVTAIFAVWLSSPWWLMYLFLLVWGADSGAYFVGRKIGRRKMVPAVSPNKSLEGLFGGLALSVLIVVVVQFFFLKLEIYQHILFLILSIFTVLGSVLGDLLESMIKRRAGVKDSGSILPGHGGVLDRIDSLLAAAPIFAAGIYLLKLIGVDL